ncbi:MAG TPA: S8 family serine peptidase [Thermoanaerobaculia bacterium]|nr:S8 family serine peptidase [Thermoanaerobaculia bacterium]
MATRKGIRAASPPDARIPEGPGGGTGDGTGVRTTGRFIVIFKEDAAADRATIRSTMKRVAGVQNLAASADYEGGAASAEDMAKGEAVQFNHLGVVVMSGEDAMQALSASASDTGSPILAVEPEYIAYHSRLPDEAIALQYLRGYRDAVNHVYDQLSRQEVDQEQGAAISALLQDTDQLTWGLQATRVSTSSRNGQGIKVAILDTGLDLQHPDFRGRQIVSESFVAGISTAQDIHGHGTHCVGTACGPQRPASGVRRYGVAFGSQIFVGKVFDNKPEPEAATGDVLAGIEWAITNGCRVVSLSLGIPINQKVDQYEEPIRRALNAGTLVVAAAGNNAERPRRPGFVEPPANADAAMAVAAVDSRLRIAEFSARSSQLTGVGGIVNIAGPGVAVFSSVPGGHDAFSGTSMATPHVAGIAALWAQATGESGPALWNRLLQTTRPLSLPSLDVGSGLIQAPQ